MAMAPEGLLNLSKFLYPWPVVFAALPLSREFIGLNLAEPNFILAILVGAGMWLQQKMSMTTPTDARQAQQSQIMLWMMPMMFTLLAMTFPSGLALFWVSSSIVRIVLQYRITGWGGLRRGGEERQETGKDKKYVDLVSSEERKSTDDVGADIVITDKQEKPSKMRYLPGKDRAQQRRKK